MEKELFEKFILALLEGQTNSGLVPVSFILKTAEEFRIKIDSDGSCNSGAARSEVR